MKLLLISNSHTQGSSYLEFAKTPIKDFLGSEIKTILFIPYAAVDLPYDEYVQKVAIPINEIGYQIKGIHQFSNPKEAIEQAEAILVGGGNTWQLLNLLQESELIDLISKKVKNGTPYIGWSAGSNLACPSIKTTNDMPIVEPKNMSALNLVPFQINPHYLDHNPLGHGGETREERILEFLEINKEITVLGLRESTMLKIENNQIVFIGIQPLRIFKYGIEPYEIDSDTDLNFLLKE